jgi:hypothetical protein
MRLRGTTFAGALVVALAATTPGLQAQGPPAADERNRQVPDASRQTQPLVQPQPPEGLRPFSNPKPFGDLWFGRGPLTGPSARRTNRVVCGLTIIEGNPDTDRSMLKRAPERADSIRRVSPGICAE